MQVSVSNSEVGDSIFGDSGHGAGVAEEQSIGKGETCARSQGRVETGRARQGEQAWP